MGLSQAFVVKLKSEEKYFAVLDRVTYQGINGEHDSYLLTRLDDKQKTRGELFEETRHSFKVKYEFVKLMEIEIKKPFEKKAE